MQIHQEVAARYDVAKDPRREPLRIRAVVTPRKNAIQIESILGRGLGEPGVESRTIRGADQEHHAMKQLRPEETREGIERMDCGDLPAVDAGDERDRRARKCAADLLDREIGHRCDRGR